MQHNPLDEKPLYRRNYAVMQDKLMAELKMAKFPVAVKYFYTELEVEYFKKWHDYNRPETPTSFCECEYAAGKNGEIMFLDANNIGCEKAKYIFNLQENNDANIEVPGVRQLQAGVLGIAIAPLKEAQLVADTINFYCDQDGTEQLLRKWQDIAGIEPAKAGEDEEAPSCITTVFVHNENITKFSLAHSCKETNCQKENGEYCVIVPGDHLKHLTDHICEVKVGLGSTPLSRPGDGFFRYTLG